MEARIEGGEQDQTSTIRDQWEYAYRLKVWFKIHYAISNQKSL